MPVNIIDTLKPKNGLSFPVVEAIDVFVENYGNLADAISHFATDAMIAAINAVLSGKANTSDVNTAVANLQGQINQIVISASSESVVAPEVAAARVSEDGTEYTTLKERLDGEDTQIQNQFDNINNSNDAFASEIFTTSNFTKISKIRGVSKSSLKSANVQEDFITVFNLDGYDSYVIITSKECSIWISDVESAYFSISYGCGYLRKENVSDGYRLYCSGDLTRVRSTDNNLPTENNKLTLPRNTAIVFTVPHNADQTIYGFDGEYELSDSFAHKTSNVAVTALTDSGEKDYTSNSNYDVIYDSKYADASGMNDNALYISYGATITQNTELYTKSRNGTYFSICVYDDQNFSNGVRYRAFGQEDTLPYENSPLSLTAGQYVVFSVQKADINFDVALSEVLLSLRHDIPLADTHIKQVTDSIQNKNCVLRYVGGSGVDYSTERVEVFIPTGNGYIEYEFVHSVYQDSNADIWRMAFAYACNNSFSKRYALTVGGEWECAVHLPNRADFSGGVTHGDEVLTDEAVFFINGSVVDISDYTDYTPFTNLVVVEASELFDPNDSTTVIANHGSEHIFSADGLKINQSLQWVSSQELTNCYMAMHLPAKSLTDHMYTDNGIIPFEITTYPVSFDGAKCAVLYGKDSGVRTEFSIGEYPVIENGNELLLTDNGGQAYNKCYYVITTGSSVAANTLWKTETNYKFDLNV